MTDREFWQLMDALPALTARQRMTLQHGLAIVGDPPAGCSPVDDTTASASVTVTPAPTPVPPDGIALRVGKRGSFGQGMTRSLALILAAERIAS